MTICDNFTVSISIQNHPFPPNWLGRTFFCKTEKQLKLGQKDARETDLMNIVGTAHKYYTTNLLNLHRMKHLVFAELSHDSCSFHDVYKSFGVCFCDDLLQLSQLISCRNRHKHVLLFMAKSSFGFDLGYAAGAFK